MSDKLENYKIIDQYYSYSETDGKISDNEYYEYVFGQLLSTSLNTKEDEETIGNKLNNNYFDKNEHNDDNQTEDKITKFIDKLPNTYSIQIKIFLHYLKSTLKNKDKIEFPKLKQTIIQYCISIINNKDIQLKDKKGKLEEKKIINKNEDFIKNIDINDVNDFDFDKITSSYYNRNILDCCFPNQLNTLFKNLDKNHLTKFKFILREITSNFGKEYIYFFFNNSFKTIFFSAYAYLTKYNKLEFKDLKDSKDFKDKIEELLNDKIFEKNLLKENLVLLNESFKNKEQIHDKIKIKVKKILDYMLLIINKEESQNNPWESKKVRKQPTRKKSKKSIKSKTKINKIFKITIPKQEYLEDFKLVGNKRNYNFSENESDYSKLNERTINSNVFSNSEWKFNENSLMGSFRSLNLKEKSIEDQNSQNNSSHNSDFENSTIEI